MTVLRIRLRSFDGEGGNDTIEAATAPRMEFHIAREVRDEFGFDEGLFSARGNAVFADFHAAREFAQLLNMKVNPLIHPERYVKAGKINAMGLIDEILHYVAALYRKKTAPDAFKGAAAHLEKKLGKKKVDELLRAFVERFPPLAVYRKETSVDEYLAASDGGEPNRSLALEELMMLRLANLNPAFEPFSMLFDDADLKTRTVYEEASAELEAFFAAAPSFGPEGQNLWDLLRSPAIAEPYSLTGQLEYIRKKWGLVIGEYLLRLLTSLDLVKEEEKPVFFGPGPTRAYVYDELEHEYERFSQDKDWMPRVVLVAKSTLVWLFQLSKKYGRPIERLDEIPDEDLDELASRGFTGLWLIGLWERSEASEEIKRRSGNPEAAASAYSLHDYDIAEELGGWSALENLKSRCAWRGIKLASDMVPNHTGVDSRWVMEHPDRFLQLDRPPFPGYSFNGENLSKRPGVGVYLEDHYWDRSDAAVVFKRVDFGSGDTRYIYHGNDGTSMPWNDTAQIDFLNPEAREAVIATIVGVCRQFPIVRFDAAMTLAKKHIQRLWYPEPGRGGDIASRAERALSREEFDRRIPNEFWREVVDRCAAEAPDTLLLAEAFWMMEGFFVRTLGMHRVYNSAFMNMLKNEENAKYRATIKNTIEFDPEILKRFVNFMNNPDEDTAVAQFGKGDKYFGVCTLMATMPGLPMFGHGQIEGFEEKYGMEYRRAYRDETADRELVERHEREIFPLLKKRRLFSGSEHFALFDLTDQNGKIAENVFAYSNRQGDERSLVFYNNAYERAAGWIRVSAPSTAKGTDGERKSVRRSVLEALGLALGQDSGKDRFILLREQRTGLWFIRASGEIGERGLFASLDGYKSQVFFDIHAVADDSEGRWKRLCEELNGSGVPDPQAALQDLFLRDLYAVFLEIAQPTFFGGLRALVAPPAAEAQAAGRRSAAAGTAAAASSKPSSEPFVESLRAPVIRFVRIAVQYLDGASGRYEAFEQEPGVEPRAVESVWEEFALSIRRLALLAKFATKPPAGLSAEAARMAERIAAAFAADPPLPSRIGGYLCMALLRGVLGRGVPGEDAKRLVDHWCLDRKLREALQADGENGMEAFRTVGLMKLILSRTRAPGGALGAAPERKSKTLPADGVSAAKLAADIAKDAFESEDSRAFLGTNVFEGVAWFVKERFEEALLYASIVSAVESDQAEEAGADTARWRERLDAAARIVAEIERANEAAGFRVDSLLAELDKASAPTVTAAPKPAKKGAGR